MPETLLKETNIHFTKHLKYYIKWSPFIESMANIESSCALEVGCGARYILPFAKEKYGVDLNRWLLRSLKDMNSRVNVVVADARYLPFRGDAFDMVAAVFLLHHLVGSTLLLSENNVKLSFKEMLRVSNDDGILFIVEHLCKNKLMTKLMFYATFLSCKLRLQFAFLGIRDRVVTYFLDENSMNRMMKNERTLPKIVRSDLWTINKIALGNSKQILISKIQRD